MARYDDEYTTRARRPGRGRWSAARRPRGRRRPARAGRRWSPPGPAYGEEYIIRSRMGMHDFGEHYGRYSGGSPYSYEYSERTIQHRHPSPEHDIGFTRPLHEEGGRRFPFQGRTLGRRRSERRRG